MKSLPKANKHLNQLVLLGFLILGSTTLMAQNDSSHISSKEINFCELNDFSVGNTNGANVWLNPYSNELYVDLSKHEGENITLKIYDFGGKLIIQQKLENITWGYHRMKLKDFESGSYIFNIEFNGQIDQTRFLVNSEQ